jgi:hypothetical protein
VFIGRQPASGLFLRLTGGRPIDRVASDAGQS